MSSNYNWMENHLQKVNKEFIQINKDNKKDNNNVLSKLLNDFACEFKKDDLFKLMYSTTYYAGSYWDGLKISDADEYDIDFLLSLPKLTKSVLQSKNATINIKLTNVDKYLEMEYSIRTLKRKLLDDDDNLDILKVNAWFESLVQKAITAIKANSSTNYKIIKSFKSGPAKTVRIKTNKGKEFDVDLVPSFKFGPEHWPEFCRDFPNKTRGFIIVPKLLKGLNITTWRLSFQDQEKEIIHNKENMKAAIRLVKRLRDADSLFATIKSYYIKSMFLLEIYDYNFEFEKKSLSAIFIHMLKKFYEYIASGNIPYFWITSINLLKDCNKSYLLNVEGKLAKIIKKLETKDEEFLKSIFIKK